MSTESLSESLQAKYSQPGWAKIKTEYIKWNHVPQLSEVHVKQEDLQKLQNIEAPEAEAAEHPPEENKETGEVDLTLEQPPASKRPKLKGRTKGGTGAKIDKKPPGSAQLHVKLCPSLLNGGKCIRIVENWPGGCKFEHDVAVALQHKKPNLEGPCPSVRAHGYCEYGVMCRFSDSHPADMPREPPAAYSQIKQQFLTKDLQHLLWKRQYKFSRANAALKDSKGKEESGLDDGMKNGQPAASVSQREVTKIDFGGKLYLAPLTTVGNLPFRRVCKALGADITCGEMAMAANLLQGQQSEWALLKRHVSEDIFGVQICGSQADMMTRCAQLIDETCQVDFVDINCGCPIDMVYQRGAGSGLLRRENRFEKIVRGMRGVLHVPLTAKIRTGVQEGKNIAHSLLPKLRDWGLDMVTLHGRSREQRYSRLANWEYIRECADVASPLPLFGNGDILSFEDYNEHLAKDGVSGCMIARGALIKPWIFTEIKEQRHWDISAQERFDLFRDFTNYGLEHWGSDDRGVEVTRRFLLEWLSFTHRYIPVGILETLPQRINERPPYYNGRNDLETLLSSAHCGDWIKISEMLLGPVPDGFTFFPKHKANAYK